MRTKTFPDCNSDHFTISSTEYPYAIFCAEKNSKFEDGWYPWFELERNLTNTIGVNKFSMHKKGAVQCLVIFKTDEGLTLAKLFFGEAISQDGKDSLHNLNQKVKAFY